MDINWQASREPFWEEMTTDQRTLKLAEAVEILGRSVIELERDNALLRQHLHHANGTLVIPVAHNQPEQPWYKSHLLNRRPR